MAAGTGTYSSSSEMEIVEACEICGFSDFSVVGTKDRHGKPLQTVLCNGCGLVFSNPRPSPASNQQFYSDSYRLEYKRTSQPSPRHTYRAGMVAAQRLEHLRPYLGDKASVLDIGAGGGEFLFLMRAIGHEVIGIEPNKGYAEFARNALNLPITTATYQNANVTPESQDLITSFHVFEHLDHPLDALVHLSSWLKLGGCIALEVPNVLSHCQWPHSRFHRAHQFHFSTTTLAHLGTRIGLKALKSFTSQDSGNAMIVFQKTASTTNRYSIHDPDHVALVRRHLESSTWIRHAFTPHPYIRPLAKLISRFRENNAVVSEPSPQQLLKNRCTERRALG